MLKKLVTKIFDKEKYVIYFENLRPGLKLKRIHGGLEFNQSRWLKQFVDFKSQ